MSEGELSKNRASPLTLGPTWPRRRRVGYIAISRRMTPACAGVSSFFNGEAIINGTLTDVMGLQVGHHTDVVNGTGCTVVLARDGAVGGVDVRGAAPGTRETDLLRAENAVESVHGIVLSGGSAYGLAAGNGVMRYLEEQGVGHRVREFIVPIVSGAIIFDLGIGTSVRPTDADGYAAAASATDAPVEQGSTGAGTGATVGKALGRGSSMKGGVGSYSMDIGDGVVLAALAVVNAIGGIHEPDTGELLAGPRGEDGKPRGSIGIYSDPGYGARAVPTPTESLGNTTLGVIATSASLTSGQTNRLATISHDGLALAVRPVHTLHDGDTVFGLATGVVDATDEFPRLCMLAPTVMARAIVNAVRNAESLHGVPSMGEVNRDA